MDAVVDKIAKLLRMAKDRKGTPEGDVFLLRAKAAMAKANKTVELNDWGDVSRAVSNDALHVVVGVYPAIEPWRQRVVQLIQMIYGIQAYWTNGIEDTSLIFSVDASKERALKTAATYYASLIREIDAASYHCPTQINTGQLVYPVRRRHPHVVRLFRRGVVDVWIDAICQHVERLAQERQARPSASAPQLGPSTELSDESVDVHDTNNVQGVDDVVEHDSGPLALVGDGPCTALARQTFTRPVFDVPPVEPPQVADQPHEADDAGQLDRLVYEHGVAYARRFRGWPVPTAEDPLDEDP